MALETHNIRKDNDIVYSCVKAQAVHNRTEGGVAPTLEYKDLITPP